MGSKLGPLSFGGSRIWSPSSRLGCYAFCRGGFQYGRNQKKCHVHSRVQETTLRKAGAAPCSERSTLLEKERAREREADTDMYMSTVSINYNTIYIHIRIKFLYVYTYISYRCMSLYIYVYRPYIYICVYVCIQLFL